MFEDEEILSQSGNSARILEGPGAEAFVFEHFGFEPAVLHRAVTAGHADAVMTTNHSPATAFGSRFWEGSIRQLRDDLARLEWRALRPGQLEVARNRHNTLQITTALGDINVGARAASPSCEHPRGAMTASAIEVQHQTFAGLATTGGWEPIETWWLIYRPQVDRDGAVRFELSLPVSMSGKRITDWAVRILLPSGDDGTASERPVRLPEGPPPVDFSLDRRAG